MSFRSKRTRVKASGCEPNVEMNSQAVDEENVHPNLNHGASFGQSSRSSGNGEDDDVDPEHSFIPNWSDKIVFDENEKVQIRDKDGRSKLRGGIILSSHVWSLPLGERFVVPFNDFYQPLRKGGHILVWFLGYIAKNCDLCPVGEKNWHCVDKVYKGDIITLVQQKFVIPPNEIVNKKILQRVGKAWRSHRSLLKKEHKAPGKTKLSVLDGMPDYIIRDQWIKLVNYLFSNECEELSNHGKEARSTKDHFHTTGNKSFAMKRDEIEQQKGNKPGPLEFYIASYKRKDGSFKEDSASKDFIDSMQSLMIERSTNVSSTEAVEDEVFNELMYGPQVDHLVVGYGFGVTYNHIFGVDGEIRSRGFIPRDNSNEEVVSLKIEVKKLKSQLSVQDDQLKELREMHLQTQGQIQHLTILLLSKFGGKGI